MGPPQSPRETRRSGRRSAPSASASTSKSPDSDQPPKQKDPSARPAPSSSTANGRNKRLKQEDLDDPVDDRRIHPAPSVASNGSIHGASNGKGKRKGKEKDKQPVSEEQVEEHSEPIPDDSELAAGDEEEQGITRCVCGSTEDDPDAGEFMIQCEGCKVWQHGPCMGFMTEDQVHDDDYYCEQCRPEQHVELLRRLSNKKGRHTVHHSSNASRVSRSRSPSQLKQPSKRRNTMNSRDFDESLKEIMEATAAEAAGKDPASASTKDEPIGNDADDDAEIQTSGKKKRKRIEDDAPLKKRTRSASTASERHGSALPRDETPARASVKPASQAPAPAKGGRNKRGGRKAVVLETIVAAAALDGEEVVSTNKRQGNGNRKGAAAKRPPLSHAVSQNSTGVSHDHSTSRARNPAGNNQHTASANADTRAYRNSHAYAVSQQPLLTSWGLPDYLAHLEHMLPTNTPRPLEVRAVASNIAPGPRGDSAERTVERGVKVKWPSKRMSVGDMNKRVRALVEWVGREQANALDRERRRDALEKELHQQASAAPAASADNEGDVVMAVDDGPHAAGNDAHISYSAPKAVDKEATSSTMRFMEELMEELISFQERFGPGAKTRERERRQGHTVSSYIS